MNQMYTEPKLVDTSYSNLVKDVILKGNRKESRTGVDTLSLFGQHLIYPYWGMNFPILQSKEISWKNIVLENLWFISGKSDITFLQDNGVHFWDPWADEDGFVPSAYGHFWRKFPVNTGNFTSISVPQRREFTDQFAWVINELKENPFSRRLVISAWYPDNALHSKLPPCHLLYVFNVQPYNDELFLNLHLTQRSCDIALGLPYNMAGYGLILAIMARLTNLSVGTISHTLVDAHIYTKKEDEVYNEYDHIPGLLEQVRRVESTPYFSVGMSIDREINSLEDVEACTSLKWEQIKDLFHLYHYNPSPRIDFKVTV